MRGHIAERSKNSYHIAINLGIDPVTKKRKQQWASVKGAKKGPFYHVAKQAIVEGEVSGFAMVPVSLVVLALALVPCL